MRKGLKLLIYFTVISLFAFSLSGCSVSGIFGRGDKEEFIYSGTAEADKYNITSETAGRVKEMKVEEGQAIKEGDLVALLDTTEGSVKLEQSELALKSAQNELDKVNEGTRTEEINAQKAAIAQSEALVAQGQAALNQAVNNAAAAQTNYDYKAKLYNDAKADFEKGIGTQAALDSLKNALDNAKAALDNSKLSVESAKSQLNGSKAQLQAANQKLNLMANGATGKTKTGVQYGVENASKGVELSKLALDKGNILSSTAGIIETINFKKGEYVAPGNPIATLLDIKNMYVKIYVPEKVLPSLKLDQEVTMTTDFIKDKTIRGKITYISPEAEFTPMNIVTKKDRMKLVYGVRVKILDNIDEIKPGMLMDINIK